MGEYVMRPSLVIFSLSVLIAFPDTSLALSAEEINAAEFGGGSFGEGPDPLVVKLQVLLDRSGSSPGVIDDYDGENVAKALRAFEAMSNLTVDGMLDEEVWAALAGTDSSVTMSYTISAEDLSGLVDEVPEDYSEMAEMAEVGYTSVEEKLAERFHMDLEFLKALNPAADFSSPGTEITVAAPGDDVNADTTRIEIDKGQAQLLAYDKDGELVAAYPVTVGSDDLPSPSGTHEVVAVAVEATYSYQPDKNFQQGENDQPLTLPAGPNNPVGGIWIDLSEPTYGLHGTPRPDLIDKTQSHGCVRMTNWDALELAGMVEEGTVVEFMGQ